MTPTSSVQSRFLERVRGRMAENISFADELADLLNISRDSAYRRIRGETILSLEEAKTLYGKFGISIDELFSDGSQMVTFHRRVVTHDGYDIEKWQNSVLKNLEYLNGFSEKKLIFSAKDIPVFHYFRLRDLCAFKHFFWLKTLMADPEFDKKHFTVEAVPPSLLHTAEKAWQKYSAIPTMEIWHEEIIYDTLKHIQFYHECDFFTNPGDAAHLCDQLIELLGAVADEASKGVKSGGGTFDLYKNDILIPDNSVFAKMGDRRCVYVNQSTLNLFLTFQEPFCEQTEIYLNNLIKKSILLSKTAERERTQFFFNMKKRILSFREKFT